MEKGTRLIDIHCPQCGAPAKFDIKLQKYTCAYCGSEVGISEAQKQKQGFRKIQKEKMNNNVRKYRLYQGSCTGCGAVVVFEENEALANCAFCGRSLVRSEYLDAKRMPESVIPFVLTQEEAQERLKQWCNANRGKAESRHLLPLLPELKGFYLPYELVRGPVHMSVSRMDRGGVYHCEGFINDEYVNCSKQLDNLLLDAMEPFDPDGLTEFEFAYMAGQRVKIADIPDDVLKKRVSEETAESYTPAVRKTLESKAVDVSANVSSAISMPVLLPVYYICRDNIMAAVNGQTGKVSVRAEKDSHYYFLPWWLKAILATLTFTLISFAAIYFLGMQAMESLMISGMLGFILLIITLCLYSDTPKNKFRVESGRKIFTSDTKRVRREAGKLVADEKELARKAEKPVFFWNIRGEQKEVVLRFTTPRRVLKLVVLCLVVLFFPVIIALFINGFDFSRLFLGGSAVWFCIFVPVVPIYLLKFGIVELYDNPWIYLVKENGRLKRYKEKHGFHISKEMVFAVLRAVFVPPVSLAVWFGIISFFVMVYLTAGYE